MFEIECPACGKKNTVAHTEGEALCKRCQADFTVLVRIRSAATQVWTQAIACLKSGDIKKAQTIARSINRLTPALDEDPLVWLLKLVKTDPATDNANACSQPEAF